MKFDFRELDKEFEQYGSEMLSQNVVDSIFKRLCIKKKEGAYTVMVVDDAALMRMVEREVLSENGYFVIAEAENGQIAVDKYKQYKPELIIMNIVMPIMDGIQATQQIKKINQDTQIIMVSGISRYHVVKESIQAGASGFIVEHFEPGKFIEALYVSPKEEKTKQLEVPEKILAKEVKPIKNKLPKEDNLWPESFKILSVRTPKFYIDRQAANLNKLTGNNVSAVLAKNTKLKTGADFSFEFYITSAKLNKIEFSLFYVTHDLSMYPCSIIFASQDLSKELKLTNEVICKDAEELRALMKRIFNAKAVKDIVTALFTMTLENLT